MKKIMALALAVLLLAAVFTGCAGSPKGAVNDGRARPSSCGKLCVKAEFSFAVV